MANIQVLRFQTTSVLQPQLVNHVAGETRDETAMPQAPPPVDDGIGLGTIVHLGGVGMAEARQRLEAAQPTGRGRRPKEAVDLVIAGPAPYYVKRKCEDGMVEVALNPKRWSEERELEWAQKVRDWVQELFGPRTAIVTLDLHRDESSPHVQGLVIPIDEDGRLGWCKVRDAASKKFRNEVRKAHKEAVRQVWERREAGDELADPPPLSIKSRYGVFQDSLYYRVSRGYGLERGQVGSKASHEQIDRTKAAERRQGLAESRERQATRVAVSQQQQADSAQERREADEAEARRQREFQASASAATHQLREDADRFRYELEAGQRGALGIQAKEGRRLIEERNQAIADRKAAELDRDQAMAVAQATAAIAVNAAEHERSQAIEDAKANQAEARDGREWRLALGLAPAVGSMTLEEKKELLKVRRDGAIRDGCAQGVRMLWERLWAKIPEQSHSALGSIADAVGALFGVHGRLVEGADPGEQHARGSRGRGD